MRGNTPVVVCDGDDGLCGAWDADLFKTGASTVDGKRITREHRALGWHCTDVEDLCPEHAPKETTR